MKEQGCAHIQTQKKLFDMLYLVLEYTSPGGGHSHYYANGDVPQVWVSFSRKTLLLGMKFE